jgi:hypothetical protein
MRDRHGIAETLTETVGRTKLVVERYQRVQSDQIEMK